MSSASAFIPGEIYQVLLEINDDRITKNFNNERWVRFEGFYVDTIAGDMIFDVTDEENIEKVQRWIFPKTQLGWAIHVPTKARKQEISDRPEPDNGDRPDA